MGTSTDALLWWGFNDSSEDYELPEPVREFALSLCKDEDDEDDLVYVLKQYIEEHGLAIDIIHHCHHDNAMYGLALAGTYKRAWRGDPVSFDALPELPPDAAELLRKGAEAIKWPVTEPKWWLASYWG